jgi:Lamin Tail Domain
MPRVSPAVLVVWVACTPSVPHPGAPPAVVDAGGDRPTSTSTIVEAGGVPRVDSGPRGDTRPPPGDAVGAPEVSDVAREIHLADTGRAEGAGEVPDRAASSDRAAAGRLPVAGDLKIDELLINPAGADTSREWIEVVNRAGIALDLSRLVVADAASEVALDAGVLEPDAILVLGQSLDPSRNGGAPIGFSFGNTISLNNPGDSIRLCLGPCSDGLVIDQVTWTADLGPAYDGHAAMVGDGNGNGNGDGNGSGDGGGFCPADQPFGSAGSFGSPGLDNPPCPLAPG